MDENLKSALMATLDLVPDADVIFTPEQLFPFSRKFYPLEFSLVVSSSTVAFCARKDLLHRLDRRLIEAIAAPEQITYSNDAFFVGCMSPPKAIRWTYNEGRRYRDYMDKRASVLANAQGRNTTPFWRIEKGAGKIKALIVGATNMGNVGDDIIAASIGSWLHHISVECSVYYSDFRVSKADLADFDLVIVGGGGIVYVSQFGQNETDNLANYFKIPLWAKELSIPCIVLGVGVQGRREQFSRDPLARQFLGRSLLAASDIIVRDSASREILGELTGLSIPVLPDIAFSLASQYPYFSEPRSRDAAKSIAFVGQVVSGRVAFFGSVLDRVIHAISEGRDEVAVRYFVMSNDDLAHRDRVVKVLAAQGRACTVVDLRALSMPDVMQAFRDVSAVVTARFHGLVLSIISGTPTLSVDLSFGKQSVMIRDYFPSMARNVIDESSPVEEVVEKLQVFAKDPCLFTPARREIQAVISAMDVYAARLGSWVTGVDPANTAAGLEPTPQCNAHAVNFGDAPWEQVVETPSPDPSAMGANKSTGEFDLERAKVLLQITQAIVRNAATEPTLEVIGSQLCTASQFRSAAYRRWCEELRVPPRLHRKQWEFVYILQALESAGKLSGGKSGLGFGCGREPLPAVMVARGCSVVATDLDTPSAKNRGWTATHQHAANIEDLYRPEICNRETFLQHLQYRTVNMNAIPADLVEFDFVWSSCALEHLGSIEAGCQFVLNSAKCLRRGGVAVHTTEFNLSSNKDTYEGDSTVLFRRRDIEELIADLEESGCAVAPLNLGIGERVEDGFVDLPPYKSAPHLKLVLAGYITTSIGLIITRL